MNDEPPSPDLISALRDQAFLEIEHQANMAGSYARSIAEAAYRGDELTMTVHLKQLRLCCLAMIKAHKDHLGS
jgi:hypothetical protein